MEENFESENEYSGFVIDNDNKAEWALKKIKEADAEHNRLLTLVDDEMRLLEKKTSEIDKRYENDTKYLKMLLKGYMETVSCKETKTQRTYQLLSGKLVQKLPKAVFEKDEDKLREWTLQNRPFLVKTEIKVNWAELKKMLIVDEDGTVLTEQGEIVEGITSKVEDGEFDIKF